MTMRRKDSTYYRMIQSPQWVQLRRCQLTAHPLCEICLSHGLYVSATEVHHVTPCETAVTHAEMRRLMFDPSNLQSLCRACHREEHRRLMSSSREEIRRRNDARTERFVARFLDNESEGYSLISNRPLDTNPLPISKEINSGNRDSVGGDNICKDERRQ